MTFIPADTLSLSVFVIFSIFMYSIISCAVWKTSSRKTQFLTYFNIYLLLFCVVVALGLPEKYPIPVIPILFVSIVVGAVLFAFSEFGTKIGLGFSMAVLVGFQSFRLPLEILLHHWSSLETVPSTMTWTGQNWDIVTGIVALISIPFVNKIKTVAWLSQIVGMALLLNVIRVVIMSSPLPFAWQLDHPIQLILFLPYALIGPLFVGAALAGHLITFRRLLKK